MQLDERLIIAPIRSTKSGLPGPIGPQGPKGEPGEDGKSPQHQWSGTNLRFTNPDGSWGKYTDLKGDKGDPGSGGGTSISVEDEAGNKAELEILKYDTTDQRIQYDPATKTLSLRSIEHAYQLDWSVNSTAELPTGDKYIGAVVYVKSDSAYMWYDGTNWNRLLSQDFSAEKLFSMMENGKWGDAHLTPTKDKIVIDAKDSFLGVFSTLSDLQSSPLKPVNGQSWAIVQSLPSNQGVVANLIYTYVSGAWSAHPVNGNFLFDNSGRVVSVTHIKAGDNVTMDYNETRHELTINSAGPGAPTDLSKYVKGENVSSPAGDWSEVNWDEAAKTLSISVPKPDFDKMNSVLVAGDNVSFEKDPATGLLRIGAEFNPDFTPYVRGRGITANNGLNSSWDTATQQLTIGYSPKFTDVNAMFEAGDNITIEKGTGEKVKISATGGAAPDLTEYAKKANIKIPAGYWGTTVVDADEVQLNVKPSADQFASMLSPNGDLNVEVDGDQVKLTTKDGRKRLYSVLTKTVGGKDPMLKAGRFMHLELDDVNRVIQLDCTAREFESTSVNTSLPLRSTWDGPNNNTTISFDMPAFANLTSPGGNVKVTYDDTQKKLAYNVDQSAIPVLAFKKAEEPSVSLGTLKINNGGSALTVTDDPDNPGKKLATLNLPDAYQVTAHANNKDQKMTDLTIISDVEDQTLFLNGNLSLDLTKGYYVGRVNTQNDLPAKAVNDKSYGFVKSPNGFDRQYIFTNDAWTMYNPVGGMLLTDGSTYQVVTQIKNNSAVTFSNGELTINQSGVVYKNGATETGMHSIEVTGAGVNTTFNAATGALKLDIPGAGSVVQTPLKLVVSNPDGSVTEFADTRQMIFAGDVGGIVGEDLEFGGKKVTLPVGVLLERELSAAQITTKYPPSKFKGRFVFNDSADSHLRKWYGCDGDQWFALTGLDYIGSVNELLSRFSEKAPTSLTAEASKDKTSWTYMGITTDTPEYTDPSGAKVRVAGFLMNMTSSDGAIVQVFYPATDFTYPQTRRWDKGASPARWSDWSGVPDSGGGSGGSGDVDAHNKAEDAHEAIILPAVVATTKTTWYDITEGQSTSRLKNVIPMMLLSDSSGKADIVDSPTGTDLYSVVVPRTGTYNLKWIFQITGIDTAHGTMEFQILKNANTVIHTGTVSVSTAGDDFDAYELMSADVALSKGDHVSLKVTYSGESAWTSDQKKEARIDAMKNYLVIEHKDSKSGTQIAKTFRSILGGFVSGEGYEAQVTRDQPDPAHAALVEVTGASYSTKVVHVK